MFFGINCLNELLIHCQNVYSSLVDFFQLPQKENVHIVCIKCLEIYFWIFELFRSVCAAIRVENFYLNCNCLALI